MEDLYATHVVYTILFAQIFVIKKQCMFCLLVFIDALQSSIGLQLVGPYDILAGKHKKTNKSGDVNFNLHWRFFYDPPEFQTVLTGDSKLQYHLGYFR